MSTREETEKIVNCDVCGEDIDRLNYITILKESWSMKDVCSDCIKLQIKTALKEDAIDIEDLKEIMNEVEDNE